MSWQDFFVKLALESEGYFEFEFAFYGYAKVSDVLPNEDVHGAATNINFPQAFLERYLSKNYHLIDSVAHLSQALQSTLHSTLNTNKPSLTPTELEVLTWLKEGASSW